MPNYQQLMKNGVDKIGQPKEQDLFILSVNFGQDADEAIDSFLVKTGGRPNFSNESYEVDFLNSRRKHKGKTSYEDLDITLIDPIKPAASKKVWQWVLRHYDPESGLAGYKSTYAAREVQLDMLSPVGTVVERWSLRNVWISDGDFGDLDYSAKEPVEISLTLSYDYPTLDEVTT